MTFRAMLEAVALDELGSSQKSKDVASKSSLKELLAGGRSQNFRRVMLGVIIQCFQQVHHFLVERRHNLTPTFQITGINLITYYAASANNFRQPNADPELADTSV